MENDEIKNLVIDITDEIRENRKELKEIKRLLREIKNSPAQTSLTW